ncbi:hypothetical protein ONE63_000238 [Megalurothrips usitatus]|uniref:Transposase n=1 Tax=Megalurothrips usitatus TaxID=439358 RepID=A0AAV7XXU3_9NEOP|nr:hypothetical protein ONE63_000238 [Megalurothrips usitatus]
MFDEMYANEGLYYNIDLDKIEGFEDLGPLGRTQRNANHVLVFMIQGMYEDFKFPVGYFPINGTCPKETLAQLIPHVIRQVSGVGAEVVASVSDQGPTNRGAITILRSRCPEGQYENVYRVDDQIIPHLWDIPHVFKSMRNNLLTSDLRDEDGNIAQWKHVIEFYKVDEGICKTSKLTYTHLCPLGKNKMRVDLAAQVPNESVASGMETFNVLSSGKYAAWIPTASTFRVLDRLFDSTNGPGRKDKPKKDRTHVTDGSYHEAHWREMIARMEKWVFIRKGTGERHVPPCLSGFIDNLRTLGRIWQTVKRKGFTELNLRKLNQDPLKNYFGAIRQTCGDGSDPTIPQLVSGMKNVLVQQVSAPGRNSNCVQDDGKFFSDLAELIETASYEPVAHTEEPALLRGADPRENSVRAIKSTKLTRQGPSLTCAKICSKVLALTNKCAVCKTTLTTDDLRFNIADDV